MTNIEQKALELVNEAARERGYTVQESIGKLSVYVEAVCRAIERHEAFAQEVSDAVTDAVAVINNLEPLVAAEILGRFIIKPPVDPLVEAFDAVWPGIDKAMVEALRAAMQARGYEWRKIGEGA